MGDVKRQAGNREKFSFGKWLAVYSVLFLVMALVIWRPFFLGNKNMIWGNDGLYQTYASMVYISKYWRGVIKSFLAGDLTFPMADPSIGMGLDVLTTLNHYGFGDILEFISVLFPREKMEWCYNFLACLRFYLTGLSFGVYCQYRKKQFLPSLGGAFVYAFSGFALYAGVRHPYFLNPMIYLPLMCLGAEQVLAGKRGYLLAIMAGISAWNNLYFFYMETVLTFLYVVARMFSLSPSDRGEAFGLWRKKMGRIFLAGCGWYLLGLALGAVVSVPYLFALAKSPRTEANIMFPNTWYAYPIRFYKRMFSGYFFPVYSADYWCVLVYPFVAFFGFPVLARWKKERENLWLGIWFLILTLILWLPVGGLVMNGLIYVGHRWIFGYSFCMALVFVLGIEKAKTINKKGLIVLAVVFCLAAFAFSRAGGDFYRSWGFAAVFLVGMWAVVMLWRRLLAETWFQSLMVGCVLISSIFSAYCLYSEKQENYVAQFCESGSAWPILTQHVSEAAIKNLVPLTSFYRVAGDTSDQVNWGMVNGVNGTGNYFSLMGKEAYDHALDMENPDLVFPTWHNGLGERASLLSLNSVRYFTKWTDSNMAVPYGFVLRPETDGRVLLYENSYAMPVGYTYDALLPASEYEALPALRKQQAIMQAAVLGEEGEAFCLEKGMESLENVKYAEKSVPYTITSMEKVQWDKETKELLVEEAGGTITIEVLAEKGTETYLRLKGLDVEGTWYEYVNVLVGAEGTKAKKLFCTSSNCSWDNQLKNFLILLKGTKEEGLQTATITFLGSGEFKLEDIECYALPMGGFVKQAEDRKQESLEADLVHNQIQGRIRTLGKRILCLSLPYSKGWSATVDGEKTPIWVCNGAHMGIFLEEGDHQICFSYETPGLAIGAFVSFFAWMVLAGMGTYDWFRKRRYGEKFKDVSA